MTNKLLIISIFLLLLSSFCQSNKKYNYDLEDFKSIINSKKPNNCKYEVYKDIDIIKCQGIEKLDSHRFKDCFVVFREEKSGFIHSFLFIDNSGTIELEMNRIKHPSLLVFAGQNNFFMKDLHRNDTIIFLGNDTTIYNLTFLKSKPFEKSKFDTFQYNFSIYKVGNDLNKISIGLKMSKKDIYIKDFSNVDNLLKNKYFFRDLNYKSYFTIEGKIIINKNLYSGEANGDPDLGDSWSKEFIHQNKVFYSILKNYEIK